MNKHKKKRTDLALESYDGKEGVCISEKASYNCDCGRILIEETLIDSSAASARLGKECGRYVTVSSPVMLQDLSFRDALLMSDKVSKELDLLKSKQQRIAVVGLGNAKMSSDSIGVKAAELILPTRQSESDPNGLCVIIPGVQGSTGISAAEYLRPLVDSLKLEMVILIDSLAASSLKRLGRTIQLSNTGIQPGSGIGKRNCVLNKETLGCDVISIGVPTVITYEALEFDNNQYENSSFILGTAEIDLLSESAARVIALAIERCFGIA